MASFFPLELVEHFISFLKPLGSPQDAEALRACALVCRDWTRLCQARIFYAVSVPENDLHRLSKLISHSPRMGQLIHELHVESSPEPHIGTYKLPDYVSSSLPNLTTLKYGKIVAFLDLLAIPHIVHLSFALEHLYTVKIDSLQSLSGVQTLEIAIQGRWAFPTFITQLGRRSEPTFTSLSHLCLKYNDYIFRVHDRDCARIKSAMEYFFRTHTTIETIELVFPSDANAFPRCASIRIRE
jgi:hypothetical protein